MDAALKAKWLEMAVREVWAQCQLARAAYRSMQAGIGPPPLDRVFLSIQALLSHSANVSKMLRAEQEPRSLAGIERRLPRCCLPLLRSIGLLDRRPTVGEMLRVANTSLVHRDGRRFRNDLEHYDERLLRWLRRMGGKGAIMDFNVAPKNAIVVRGMKSIVVRQLDPHTHVFTFSGKDLDLRLLVEEVECIQTAASRWLKDNGFS